MFRLLAVLLVGMYAAMLIGGQDRGQTRFGLMQAKAEKSAVSQPVAFAETAAEPETVAERAADPAPVAVPASQVVVASFVPEKPLMSAPVLVEAAPIAPPTLPEGRVLYVGSKSINVREGPGKDHAVIDRLPKGEAVLVLVEGEGPEGWSLIRIEGDGIEGYVASRLLIEE